MNLTRGDESAASLHLVPPSLQNQTIQVQYQLWSLDYSRSLKVHSATTLGQ
jgi:hypothetical protein